MIWNQSTRDELNAALPDAVVLLPTGATEQHGPHLATGHDAFAVTAIAHRAARAAGPEVGVVLAPTLPFGSSDHHLPFGGTLSLATETYRRLVHDLVTSMIASGARRIFLLNGHGGNRELNQLVARDLALAQPADRPVAIAAAAYWEIAADSLAADPELGAVRRPGHAGQFETATMLAMTPEHVREPRAVRDHDPSLVPAIPGTRIESTGLWASYDGYTDFPHRATAEQGRRVLDLIVRDVAAALTAFAHHPLG
jgi:creatinine amidohydrolase